MYHASEAFHTAVAEGAHQIALLIFDDAVFSNDDIDVSAGIEFNDYFNTEEDLSIGYALSNEISFNIFNDSELLNNYNFGDFTATIGAQIGDETVTQHGTVYVESASHTYEANNSSPYLKRDGSAVSSQPSRPITTMLVHDGVVYCRLDNGNVIGYKDSNGASQSVTVNNFMKAQLEKWSGEGIIYANRILKIWRGTKLRTYEFVPLGRFTAERPNVTYVNEIHMTCYDFMQKFEKDMPDNATLNLTFPCTFSTLFVKMCQHLGVSYVTPYFINSTATISARPDEFDNATMREVLQWLAEAACSVARFNREGLLVFDWLHETDTTIDENGYSEFNPYWYQTRIVEKVVNRSSDGSYNHEVGIGNETYLIQDNPLLKGVS